MYLSEHFGRAFWVDAQDEFRSCPLFVNNKPDYSQADYVSDRLDGSVRPFFSGMTV